MSLATRALTLACERGNRAHEAWALRLLGDVDSHPSRCDVVTAKSHYDDAIALAPELQMRPLVAHCHLDLGKLYRRADKPHEAQEHLAVATAMYRDMAMPFYLSQAEKEIGVLT